MRILFLSRWYPYPADNGSRIRVFNLVKYLSAHHQVHLISFADEPPSQEHIDGMKQFCYQVDVVLYKPFHPGSSKALMGFFSRRPRSIIDTYSPEMQELVDNAARDIHFDLVIASEVDMSPYAVSVSGTRKILENIEISIFYDQFIRETHPIKKVRKQLMWSKWKNYIADVLHNIDGCTVVSQPEVVAIQRAISDFHPIGVIPNGADTVYLSGDFGTPEPDTLIYGGALTYYANFDAIQFFLSDVFPLILKERPNVRLYIAGSLKGVPLERLPHNENVILVGYLEDIRPRIARSWVSVVPVRLGGGTRIKILESMALGTPVVSTTRGALGLDVTSGEDIIVADTPEDFAAAVVQILKDPLLRQCLQHNARQTVEAKYDWQIVGQQLEDLIQTVVSPTP